MFNPCQHTVPIFRYDNPKNPLLSGAGVWDSNLAKRETHPFGVHSLAGIIVEDHPSKRMAMAIRAEFIWHALYKCSRIKRHS
jgi:hypothetical protein